MENAWTIKYITLTLTMYVSGKYFVSPVKYTELVLSKHNLRSIC